jgi:formiminoglutamase
MTALRPAEWPTPSTGADDPRVGHLLGRDLTRPDDARCVLVGFPVDEGVRRNGGRPGAALGPSAIRRCLARLTPDPEQFAESLGLLAHTWDLGDVVPSGDLEADQETLGWALAPHLARGAVVVVLGGGHETAFGHFLGYVEAGRSVQILNWDAHPDVRPLVDGRGHSGSPFRQALEHPSGRCAGYYVAGLNPHAVARAHLDFLEAYGGRAEYGDGLTRARVDAIYEGFARETLVSLDLDAVDQAVAPGVSAPAAVGLSPSLWLHAAQQAGLSPRVRSIDVVELCPPLDPDDRTARLAALTVWSFWRGLAARPAT